MTPCQQRTNSVATSPKPGLSEWRIVEIAPMSAKHGLNTRQITNLQECTFQTQNLQMRHYG
jgi:hypothetical protein